MPLKRPGGVSLTMTADEVVGYVAGPDGIWRVDLKAKTTTAVTGPAGLELGRFERIRIYRSALIGIEAPADGTRRVVRLDLNNSGRAITAASVIDTSIPDTRGRDLRHGFGRRALLPCGRCRRRIFASRGRHRDRAACRFHRAPGQSALTGSRRVTSLSRAAELSGDTVFLDLMDSLDVRASRTTRPAHAFGA